MFFLKKKKKKKKKKKNLKIHTIKIEKFIFNDSNSVSKTFALDKALSSTASSGVKSNF